jgi:molybdopterin converting factor small subunit
MSLKILLFGSARAAFGADSVQLTVSPATPASLFKQLAAHAANAQDVAGFKNALSTAALAVDSEYVSWDDEETQLELAKEVALIPAVSGG